MHRPSYETVDLFLTGSGIGGLARLTDETRWVLQNATEIHHLTALDAELTEIAPHARIVSLRELYESTYDPQEAYRSITQSLLDLAVRMREQGTFGACLTYGHPMLLVNSSVSVLAHAEARDVSVAVLPAVSSFDTLLIDAPVQAHRGASFLDAEDFVRFDMNIDTRIPLFLMQVGAYGATTLRPDRADTGRFGPLLAKLSSIYSPDHPAYIVLSPWAERMRPSITVSTVETLSDDIVNAFTGTTLVLEGVKK